MAFPIFFFLSFIFGVTYTEPPTTFYECEEIYLYLASQPTAVMDSIMPYNVF